MEQYKRNRDIVKKMTFTAMCLALCVIIPFAFHMIPNSATIFCPIHIPIIICAIACGLQYGILCGVLGPVLCMLITGMPNAIALPGMIVECFIYALVSGLLLKLIHTGKTYLDLYISLIVSMIIGRIFGGIISALILTTEEYSLSVWFVTYFVKGWPAIIIQLVLIPSVFYSLVKAKFIEDRYEEKNEKKETNEKNEFLEYKE